MIKPSTRILAINPGSRYIGIAAFEGHELQEWQTKVIRGKWSSKKQRQIEQLIDRLITRYQPDALALKRLHASRSSGELDQVVARIQGTAKNRKLKTRQYAIDDLKAALVPGKKTNKAGLAEAVVAAYPILLQALETEKRNKNLYHTRMFEAVALGLLCSQRFNIN